MKKVIMLVGLLLWMATPPLKAKAINFHRSVVIKGKARSVLPQVTGDLETNVLTLSISRYAGVAQVCILDNNGNIVQAYSEVIQGQKTMDIELGNLEEGEYAVTVTLGDNVYFGIVSLI